MEINISINVKLGAPGLVSAILGLSKSLTQMKVEAVHALREEKVLEDKETAGDIDEDSVCCSEDHRNNSPLEIEEVQNTAVEEEKVGLTNKGEIESLSRRITLLKNHETNKLIEVNPHYSQDIIKEDKFLRIHIIASKLYLYVNDE